MEGPALHKSSSQQVVSKVYKVLLARNSTTVVLLHFSMGRQPFTFISSTEAEKPKGKDCRVTKVDGGEKKKKKKRETPQNTEL